MPEVTATPDAQPSEGIRARDAALQLPTIVAAAFLTRPVKLHGLTLEAYSFDSIIILKQVGNPLASGLSEEIVASLTDLQIAQLIFAIAAPERALEACCPPTADGSLSDYDRAAIAFLRERQLLPHHLPDIMAAIAKLIVEGLAAAPGAGSGNPPRPGAA